MFVFHSIHLIFIFKILMANKLKVTAATNLKISSLVPLIPDKKICRRWVLQVCDNPVSPNCWVFGRISLFSKARAQTVDGPTRSPVQNWYPGVWVSATPCQLSSGVWCTSGVVGAGRTHQSLSFKNTKLNTWKIFRWWKSPVGAQRSYQLTPWQPQIQSWGCVP